MADKDGDSTIDKKEIKHKEIAKKFDELDTDKDGTLDAKEILAFFQKKPWVKFLLTMSRPDKAAFFMSVKKRPQMRPYELLLDDKKETRELSLTCIVRYKKLIFNRNYSYSIRNNS